jgi:hypothetical protein
VSFLRHIAGCGPYIRVPTGAHGFDSNRIHLGIGGVRQFLAPNVRAQISDMGKRSKRKSAVGGKDTATVESPKNSPVAKELDSESSVDFPTTVTEDNDVDFL